MAEDHQVPPITEASPAAQHSEDKPPATASMQTDAQAELQTAEDMLQKARQAMNEGEPEEAADLLGKVLEIRGKHYGEMAEQNARIYMLYGRALFEQARSTTDAFTTNKLKPGNKQESKPVDTNDNSSKADKASAGTSTAALTSEAAATTTSASTFAADSSEATPSAAEAAGADGGGSSTGAGEQDNKVSSGDKANNEGEDEEAEAGEDEDEDNEDAEGDEDGGEAAEDMELAWEMLELARLIYTKAGEARYRRDLADVHLTLGELSAEKEEFDTAVSEYSRCQALLEAMEQPDRRMLAEVHFNSMLVLTMMDDLPAALQHCQAAIAHIKARKSTVLKVMDTPVENESEEAVEAQLTILEKELDDLDASLTDLKEKQEELKVAIEQQVSFKKLLKQSMQQIVALQEGGANGASTSAAAAAAAAAAGTSNPFTSLASTAPVATPTPAPVLISSSAPAPSLPVQNLGVAGRGRTRITLQPVQPSNTNGTVLASGAAVAVPSKRSAADAVPGAAAAPVVDADGKVAAEQQAKRARPEVENSPLEAQ